MKTCKVFEPQQYLTQQDVVRKRINQRIVYTIDKKKAFDDYEKTKVEKQILDLNSIILALQKQVVDENEGNKQALELIEKQWKEISYYKNRVNQLVTQREKSLGFKIKKFFRRIKHVSNK